jgi:hypothetical protein
LYRDDILRAMAERSARRGRSGAGPLVVAVIFLAVLGAGAGFSLGTLSRDGHVSATGPGTDTTTTPPPGGQGQTPSTPASSAPTGDGGRSGTGTGGGTRCLQHTEQQAGVSPLYQVLYLHTDKSEVWICKSTDGTLYYQGHKGQPGEPLNEGSTALFLKTIQREGSDGYVATNVDPNNGNVTKYHVTAQRLTIEHVGSGSAPEVQPAVS